MNIHLGRAPALWATAALLAALIAGGAPPASASPADATANAAPNTVSFGTPVRLPTFQSCGGYEPGIAVDRFGNIFVTAHKQNHCDAVALDPSAPDGVRAQSWLWTSSDGVNFGDMPGLTNLRADQLDVGDEGDIALDDAGHFYFVDTKVVDDSFSRWTVSGLGTSHMTQDIHRPVIPSLMPVDDRPWVTAHGATTVMYAGNEGDKDTYNVGSVAAGCTGPVTPPAMGQASSGGRYTVFLSHDAGNTFDPVGCTLPDSGWCRPAADHNPGSPYLYMFCTNDARADDNVNNAGDPGFTLGTLWSYVSADNGQTWTRYKAGNYNSDLPSGSNTNGDITWPSVTVAGDGSVYALFANPISVNHAKTGTTLNLYRSTDHGKTWGVQDVTPPNAGLIRYSWMDVARDGHTVGIGYFTHQLVSTNWHVYAGVTPGFGRPVTYSLVDPVEVAPAGDFAFGDFFEIAFDQLGRLDVVYTRCTDLVPGDNTTDCLNSDVYFARTLNSVAGGGSGGGGSCHEGDGDGHVQGEKGGTASVHTDEDACEDGNPEEVKASDANAGMDFHSTQIRSYAFDDAAHTLTIAGVGLDNGLPVAFTSVAVNGPAGVGAMSLTLSNGYAVGGTLLDGAVQLQ